MPNQMTKVSGAIPSVLAIIFCLALAAWSAAPAAGKDKIKPEELVAKHLESVGTPEARSRIQSMTALGDVTFVARVGGAGRLDGSGSVSSILGRSMIKMNFNHPEYGEETLIYTGKNVDASFVRPGRRSPLGELLYTQGMPLAEGLMGGALNLDWPLFNLEERQSKVSYKGTKKLDDSQAHQLEYRPKRSRSDLSVRLFFDEENFRHLRSEYKMEIGAGLGATPAQSSQQRPTRHLLTEAYSDFREVEGLTLPHTYRIQYSVEGQSTFVVDWEFKILSVQINQPVDTALLSTD